LRLAANVIFADVRRVGNALGSLGFVVSLSQRFAGIAAAWDTSILTVTRWFRRLYAALRLIPIVAAELPDIPSFLDTADRLAAATPLVGNVTARVTLFTTTAVQELNATLDAVLSFQSRM